jgi:7,8-dihydroneopterin aldolase/epimerase/oxygenase
LIQYDRKQEKWLNNCSLLSTFDFLLKNMLTVSLHKIKLTAPIGLYPQEYILGNSFEVDVDVSLPDAQPWPFADYTKIHEVVMATFSQPGQLLETFVYNIHSSLKVEFSFAGKIKVSVRKMNPPISGEVAYSQVSYEK